MKLKVGDRVTRKGVPGPRGTVRKVRVEMVRTTIKEDGIEPPGESILVLWDNGTLSHFVPEALEAANG